MSFSRGQRDRQDWDSLNQGFGENVPIDPYRDDEFDPLIETNSVAKLNAASLPASAMNLANSAIGAGVLAFPFAFLQTGLLLGMMIAIVQTFICGLTVDWLGKHSDMAHPNFANAYEKIVKEKLGSVASLIIVLCLLGNVIGAMTGYIIIIGDMLSPIASQLLGNHFYTSKPFLTLIFLVFGILPISSMKSIDNLKFTSTLSLVSITFVVLLITLSGLATIFGSNYPSEEIIYFNFKPSIFQAIPIITFALTCHAQAPPIYQELRGHNRKRFGIVIVATFVLCFTLYLMTGIFGYLHFLNNTSDNILNNFPQDSIAASIARVCVTFTATFSYPLMNFVFRSAIDFLFFNMGYKAIYGEPSAAVPPSENITIPTHPRYVLETVVIGVLCWIINVIIPSISTVFGLIGALAGSGIVFIFPALLELKAEGTVANKIVAGLVLAFGIGIAIIGTTVIILDFF